MDHDQRFKKLLQEFFPDFLSLFYPQWAARFDFGSVTWLEQEVFPNPPQGERRVVDLVARLQLREPATEAQRSDPKWLALVHVEIESRQSAEQLRQRMYEYYHELWRKHGLPVLPLALFLNVGLGGLGEDSYEHHFADFRPLQFQYLYVGLPALDGLRYVRGESPFGLAMAALMKLPADRRAELTAQILARVVKSPENDWKKFLLCECVQAYSPLSEEQRLELDRLLVSESYAEVKAVTKTWYEQGLEKGLEEGQRKGQEVGQRQLLTLLLEKKFGALNERTREKLAGLSVEEIRRVGDNLLTAGSLRELGLEE